jgi:hypothetical protein
MGAFWFKVLHPRIGILVAFKEKSSPVTTRRLAISYSMTLVSRSRRDIMRLFDTEIPNGLAIGVEMRCSQLERRRPEI